MVSCFKISLFVALIAILIPFGYKYKDQREYNYRTTAEQAIGNANLNGKTIIVTGSNTGIGKPTVRVLLSHGAHVIMACRNKQKAINASKDIMNTIVSSQICEKNQFCDVHKLKDNLEVMVLDLASLDSIDAFCQQFMNKYTKLNYLILNAGTVGLWNEWSATKDGIESVFGINHIGHYYLTMKLTPLLSKSASVTQISRVISVASAAHKYFTVQRNITEWLINDNKVQNATEYGYVNYGFSKACNILFAKEYNDRYHKQNVYSVSVHPGIISTELSRNRPKIVRWFISFVHFITSNAFLKTVSRGAASTVRIVALSDEQFKQFGGSYFVDCNVANEQLSSPLFPNGLGQENEPQILLWNLSNHILKTKGKTTFD